MSNNTALKDDIRVLCTTLRAILLEEKTKLSSLHVAITNDVPTVIGHDHAAVVEQLETFVDNFYRDDTSGVRYKPKGNVLLLLSYNEPFIMNVLPILQALAAGNTVHVRPSSAAIEFTQFIWERAVKAHPELAARLHILSDSYDAITERIPTMQAVYFFGSLHNARKIGQACAAHSVEFWPETEGADHAVYFNGAVPSGDISRFADYCLRSAYTHAGQMCQRLQGIFVQSASSKELVDALKAAYDRQAEDHFQALVPQKSSPLQSKLREIYEVDLQSSNASEHLPGHSNFAPMIAIEPDHNSALCRTAYFLPSFWIVSFASEAELLDMLTSRPLHFGLNIWCSDEAQVQRLVGATPYTRYTLNTDHTPIRTNEGWGGAVPTSFGGYMDWRAKFSTPYITITT